MQKQLRLDILINAGKKKTNFPGNILVSKIIRKHLVFRLARVSSLDPSKAKIVQKPLESSVMPQIDAHS
jgi:hypothetical protein